MDASSTMNYKQTMITKKLTTVVLAALTTASLLCAIPARAAVITWGNPQYIAADTDVATTGTLVAAYSLNAGAATINGVAFANGSASVTSLTNATYGTNFLLSVFTTHYATFGSNVSTFASLSQSYRTLLSNGIYGGSISGAGVIAVPVITATNLTFGHEYLLQVWTDDSRSGRSAGNYANLYGDNDGNTVNMYYNSTGAGGGVGQYSIGTFVADGNTQPFSIIGNTASLMADTYLNAVQLRDLGPASFGIGIGYWNGLASGTLDTTSLNFCTNLDSALLGTAASLTTLETLTNACYFDDVYYANSTLIPVTTANINVAPGGVALGDAMGAGTVNFLNSTNIYIFTSSDANGIKDGSNPTSVNMWGTGLVIFDGANSYSGGTVINAGTLQVGNADANGSLGSGPVTDNASLVFNRTDAPTFNNVISGYGNVIQSGSGTLTLGGINSYIGRTIVNAGTLSVTGLLNNGLYASPIVIAANSTFSYNSGNSQSLSGVISGAGALTLNGGGSLTLSGASTFTGGVTVGANNTLYVNSGGNTTGGAGKGPVTLNGNGVLVVNMGNSTLANVSVTGGTSSTMNINLSTGNEWLTNTLANFQGTFNVNYSASGGQLVVGNGAAVPTPINPAATWQIYQGTVVDFNGLQTNPATVYLYGLPYASAGDGALRLDESVQSGPVILNGYSEIGNGNATGVSTVSGVISDNGNGYGFIKTGADPIVLTAVNTYHGATVVSNGTLAIGAGGSIANSSGVALAPGATFDVSATSGFTIGSSQTLATDGGSSLATINGSLTMASGASLSLTNGSSIAPLMVANGTMTLNNISVTINVSPYTPMVNGGYLLISNAPGASVVAGGSFGSSTVTISGLVNNGSPSLSIVNGSLYAVFAGSPAAATYSPLTYSNLYAFVGSPGPTYSINALGNGLSYYWYSNGVMVAGANNSSFTPVTTGLPAGQLTNTVLVSNVSGTISNTWIFNVLAANSVSNYPAAVLSNNPIAYWRLNEPGNGLNNGNPGVPCNDYVGGHYTTYTNVNLGFTPGYRQTTDPTETAAQIGVYKTSASYAGFVSNIYFPPGTNNPFGAPNTSNVNFTVECWAQPPVGLAGSTTFLTEGFYNTNDAFSLSVNSTHQYRFYCRNAAGGVINAQANGTSPYTAKVPDGYWHHLVGVFNETGGSATGTATASIYVDGQLEGTTTVSTGDGLYPINSGTAANAYVSIGCAQNNSANGTLNVVNCPMSDVAIYNTNLTAAQVLAHYNAAGVGPSVPQPVSFYLDQGGTLVVSPTQTGSAAQYLNNGATLDYFPAVSGSTPMGYSWVDGNNNQVISTSATLVVSNIQNSDNYFLTVSNIFGTNTGFSLSANVVLGAPSFYTNISPGYAAVYAGSNVTFFVMAFGMLPMSYQWSISSNGAAAVAIPHATNDAYTAIAVAGSTNVYTCTVTGLGSVTSSSGTLVGIALPIDFYGATIMSNNPVAYWRLQEKEQGGGDDGIIAHDYAGQHNAYYNNAELGLPGFDLTNNPDATAALFGVYATPNSYAAENTQGANTVPNVDFSSFGSEGTTAEFSVEAWVKGNGSQANGAGIVAKGYPGAEQFILECTNNAFQFYLRDSVFSIYNCQSAVLVTDGNWHHLVGVCDEGNGASYLYVDGVLQVAAFGMQPGKSVVEPGSNPLDDLVDIGARAASSSAGTLADQFVGEISDVALYNYAMSSNMVAAHYTAGIPPVISLSPFSITSVSSTKTNVVLTWQSVSGYTYQVQVAPVLGGGTNGWVNLGAPIVATGTNTLYTDSSTNATGEAAYYKVVGY